MTVTATLNGPAGQGKHAGRTFTQRAIIAKLVAVIDDLPAVPYYAVPCPLFNTYSLRFNPLRGYGASVTVESLSCVAASVTVGGRDQPPLWDSPPRLEPLALQLLGLRSEPGSHAEIQSQIRSQTGGGPRPGSRAEALAYGRHLLTLPVLPLGTRAAKRGQHVPTEISSPAPPFAKDLVSLTRPLVAPGTPAQVQAYLLAHAPKGAERSWGQMGRPGAPTAWDVGFFLPTPQEGLYLAQLEVTMAPAANRTSVVNETAYVIWFPTRSPAENLLNPAGYRSVTVTADVVYPHTREVTRALSGLTATRLLMFLGGQQAAPDDAPVSCPMRGAEFTLRFLPAKPRTPAVRVTTYGCWADDIWINGVRQPALWDMGTLHSMTVHLLGLPGWLR